MNKDVTLVFDEYEDHSEIPVNFDVRTGTTEYYVERNRFVRKTFVDYMVTNAYIVSPIEQARSIAYSPAVDLHLLESAERNWQLHFLYMVLGQIPRRYPVG